MWYQSLDMIGCHSDILHDRLLCLLAGLPHKSKSKYISLQISTKCSPVDMVAMEQDNSFSYDQQLQQVAEH